jgi:hypothetical protein
MRTRAFSVLGQAWCIVGRFESRPWRNAHIEGGTQECPVIIPPKLYAEIERELQIRAREKSTA